MSNWLKLLPTELSLVDNFVEPEDDMQSNDNYVGDMTTELKKLYTLWKRLSEVAARSKVDYEFSNASTKEALLAKWAELREKAKTLRYIFWVCVQDEFPELWSRESIGVRRGFKVVWSEEKDSGPEFFRQVFGDTN